MFKKIIKSLLNISFIKNLYLKIFWKQSGKTFCLIYNLISRLFYNFKTQITFNNGYYVVKENNNIHWRFKYPSRGFYYLNGIKNRGKLLHQQYLIQSINFFENDIIIDVGANIGDFYLNFNKKINYFAIEASPIVYSILEKNINNQNLINKAVFDTDDKTIPFYLDDENADSSAIKISNYTSKINIKTITLDTLLKKIDNPVKLIKLEAEGAEIEILKGLNQNLHKVAYITIDCGFERGIEKQSTLKECLNYLLKKNFEIIDFSTKRIVILLKNNKLII